MTDHKNLTQEAASKVPAKPASGAQPFLSAPAATKPRRAAGVFWLWLIWLLTVAGGLAGGYVLHQKFKSENTQLIERQQTNERALIEAGIKSQQALDTLGQMQMQLVQLTDKLDETQTRQQALERLSQKLTQSRDDWMLAEVEQTLAFANEQLQLTGNAQRVLVTLHHADTQLAASTSPRALAVRKALGRDLEALKATPHIDLMGLALKLDAVLALVDRLPLAGEVTVPLVVPTAHSESPTEHQPPLWQIGWQRFKAGAMQQLASFVQVRRLDHADTLFVAPDQGYFLRENLKLRLLAARLSLFARNAIQLKADVQGVTAALTRYFDAASTHTSSALESIKQIEQASADVALPSLEASLQAVRQQKSGS